MKKHRCPRCGSALTREQFLGTIVVCSCGWTSNATGSHAQTAADRSSALGLLFWLLIFAGGVFHFMVWDNYAVDIIVPKVKQLAKVATPEDLHKVASICEKREKLECKIGALEQLVELDPENQEALMTLAETYRTFNEDGLALETYEAYFAVGGQDLKASVAYAELTGDIGDVATSRYYFRRVLDAKPNVFQASVTRSYVKMLLANHQDQMAGEVIRYYRGKSENAKLFMQKELDQIQRNIAAKTRQ